MALILADRVKETSTTTGNGVFTLAGAATGFQSFAIVGNGNTTFYCIAGQGTNEWEVGIGTYATSGTTLTRTTVLSNSSATQPSALSFAAGTKDVFVTYPSEKSVNLDASGNVGIGAASTGEKLYVYGSGNAPYGIHINTDNAGSSTSSILIFGNNANAAISYIQQNSSTNTSLGGANSLNVFSVAGAMTFSTGSAERIRIDSSGNVTISAYGAGVAKFDSAGVISSGTVTESLGGTNQTTYTTGDILYASAANTLSKLPAGTVNYVLTSGGAGVAPSWAVNPLGTVTSVGFTGGIITVATATTTPAFTVAGTSGGIPYFASASTWATSAALAANSLVQGGGAGVAPSTITTGANVITALGVAVGSAGAFVTNGGALGTPSGGTVTNLTGTASININGTVGATTPTTVVGTTGVFGSATSLLVGTAGTAVGSIGFRNATSGTATIAPPTGALGTYQVTMPNAASTLPIFGQQITFAGPTAARTITLPDASFTVARTDAANTFTGVQTMTSPNFTTPVLGTVTSGVISACTSTNMVLVTPTFNSASLVTISGTAPLYMCRAWVNFNGTGTIAITGSGNVSSITDNGTGDYTVNFTTAMVDANYCLTTAGAPVNNNDLCALGLNYSTSTKTTTALRLAVKTVGIVITNSKDCNVAIFR